VCERGAAEDEERAIEASDEARKSGPVTADRSL
jgi:hypothetical protein